MDKEGRFYDALKDVFIGAKVEGQSGYINLMKVKSQYFENVFQLLNNDVNEALALFPGFRDELFDKLYNFFHRYFSKSGSIYFTHTPIHQNVYEQIYTDDRDVMLFWKTHMLYYVKTDRLYKNLDVEIDSFKFFFDVSTLEYKRANEKRELVYEFKEKRGDGVVTFTVSYSERGKKTKTAELVKSVRKAGVKVDENILDKAFRVFAKQSEVDYFINKNAKKFLQEQLDIWFYQYVFSGESNWTQERIKQLQTLKEIALRIIDFISQFEDELVKIWNKPKFVLNSNYVITLDRLAERDIALVDKIIDHPNFGEQCQEWKNLGIIREVKIDSIVQNKLSGKELNNKYKHLPIDTKYFKDLEYDILQLFDNLDQSLDGWLIRSENYQALNTVLPKFERRVQSIYIDPPFNLEQDADFFYSVKYKDSSWITLLENRLQLAKVMLSDSGSIFLRCDYNGNMYVRLLMDQVFGEAGFRSEIVINRFKRQLDELTKLNVATDSLFFYGKTDNAIFKGDYRKRICTFCGQEIEPEWRPMSSPGLRKPPERVIKGKLYLPPKGRHWTFSQNKINQMDKEGRIRINPKINYADIEGNKVKGLPEYLQTTETPIDSNWTDLRGYAFAPTFPTRNAEELIARSIEVTSEKGELVLDYFLGSGTTAAVAHKLNRKWLGIEMAEHFNTEVLPRMKRVLSGEKSEISKEIRWEGGGFFKYCDLEQYEDVLRKAAYQDADLFANPYQDPYSQYVFLKDEKMLSALDVDYENNKVKVDVEKLYDHVDVAETLSNLLGKWIRKITPEYVELENGDKISLKHLDYKMIKPLIWW